MTGFRPRHAIASALALVAALVLASCAAPNRITYAFYCTASIGDRPDFTLAGFSESQPFQATRPGSGVTIVEIPIVDVLPDDFDFVLWDALDRNEYDQPPEDMQFYVEPNPTMGTNPTVLKINVYAWTAPGTYLLKLRGLAYQGNFFDDAADFIVGECFHDFVLVVD